MLAVFFFAVTPHEFIHDEIASKKDTVDGIHTHPGISKIHIHSEFLRVSLSPTLPGEHVILCLNNPEYNIYFETLTLSAHNYHSFHYFLRGPPSSC